MGCNLHDLQWIVAHTCNALIMHMNAMQNSIIYIVPYYTAPDTILVDPLRSFPFRSILFHTLFYFRTWLCLLEIHCNSRRLRILQEMETGSNHSLRIWKSYRNLHWICNTCRASATSPRCKYEGAGLGAQLDARQTGNQEIAGSTPAGSATFFLEIDHKKGHFHPSADSRRAVVNFRRKNVHNAG